MNVTLTLTSSPPCCLQSLATWESENKIHCKQTLVGGDGPKTFWTRELNGDELTLVRALTHLQSCLTDYCKEKKERVKTEFQ